ncbi:MAG: hypothetical protein BVN35_20945 [Proteobacteria bacterium ST_bin11]|nr:MAG: hypothetical protein BVN35_20945 [Proteobacteria bacterium ST_bin11]
MDTENQAQNRVSREQMALIDAVLLSSERARCVLELVSDAMIDSELLPALRVAIDPIEDIDHTIKAWKSGETINA